MTRPIAGYDYDAPDRDAFHETLRRVLGEQGAQQAWIQACEVAGVRSRSEALRPDALKAIAAALVGMGGLPGVVGNSLTVRMITYDALARQGRSTAREATS